MYDKELALDSLSNIKSALEIIIERASVAASPDDFLMSPDGMMRLDKITKGELLPNYPKIFWSGVMKMRNKIAHHYFEMDAEVVFKTLIEDIPAMLPVVQRMTKELK
ncbi:DUF86 domain-containing protein [Bacteroides sp.]|uniref:HepT-like ribonuclease domain-containing protein n=1 Tax=Bacteroides sp. TaxID=29523 RepID=UPI003AB53E35